MRYPRVVRHTSVRLARRRKIVWSYLEVLTRPDDAETPCEGFPNRVWRWPRDRIRGG